MRYHIFLHCFPRLFHLLFSRLLNSLSHFSRLFLHTEEKVDEVIDVSEDEKETKYFGGNFTGIDYPI